MASNSKKTSKSAVAKRKSQPKQTKKKTSIKRTVKKSTAKLDKERANEQTSRFEKLEHMMLEMSERLEELSRVAAYGENQLFTSTPGEISSEIISTGTIRWFSQTTDGWVRTLNTQNLEW